MKLDEFKNTSFDRGASKIKETLWVICSGLFFSTWLPGSKWRVVLLRLFGAKMGVGICIKPRVRIKFPWKLSIGNYCWIGEDVWIDNLASTSLGEHVCISQGVSLCTGSHDWSKSAFDLFIKSIVIGSHVWISAYCRVAPGVVIEEGAVLGFASVATHSLEPWTIYYGVPASPIKKRILNRNKNDTK